MSRSGFASADAAVQALLASQEELSALKAARHSWTSAVTVPASSFPGLEHSELVVSEHFGVEPEVRKQKRALLVGCDYPQKPGTIRAGVLDAMQWRLDG